MFKTMEAFEAGSVHVRNLTTCNFRETRKKNRKFQKLNNYAY